MLLRKEKAGSTSLGHTWDTDGAVVEVPDEHASLLLRILDGGFSVVDHLFHHEAPVEAEVAPVTEPEPPAEPDPAAVTEVGEPATVTEVAAAPAEAAGEPTKRVPAKAAKAAAPKTA